MGPLCGSCQARSAVTGPGQTDWAAAELSVLGLAALLLRTDYAAAQEVLGHRVSHVVLAQVPLAPADFDFHKTTARALIRKAGCDMKSHDSPFCGTCSR